MKPVKFSEAHSSDKLAELVCSNSLRGNVLSNAVGLLKEEMRRMGSIIMEKKSMRIIREKMISENMFILLVMSL